jgi:hypothetical protein
LLLLLLLLLIVDVTVERGIFLRGNIKTGKRDPLIPSQKPPSTGPAVIGVVELVVA